MEGELAQRHRERERRWGMRAQTHRTAAGGRVGSDQLVQETMRKQVKVLESSRSTGKGGTDFASRVWSVAPEGADRLQQRAWRHRTELQPDRGHQRCCYTSFCDRQGVKACLENNFMFEMEAKFSLNHLNHRQRTQ